VLNKDNIKRNILWIIMGLAFTYHSLSMILGLIYSPQTIGPFVTMGGYTLEQGMDVGIMCLIATIFYVIPRTSVLGAILMTAFWGGAAATEFRIGHVDTLVISVIIGVLAWAGVYVRDSGVRSLIPLRRN
jgi:hypothetical protein